MNGLAKKGYDISYQTHNFPSQMLKKGCIKLSDDVPLNFDLYGSGKEQYSKDLIIPRIRELKPDIFSTLLDTFMLYGWYEHQNFAPALSSWWYPSDGGGGLPLNCENILKKINIPVAMSRHGQRQVKAIHNIDTHHIPHGVDTDLFKPISEKAKDDLKQKWGLTDKFVVGSVFRNQPRKMADRLIKGFYGFAKKHEDAVLLLHCDPNDISAPFNINILINRYKLNNRVLFTGMNFFNTFTYEKLVDVYNLMDVFALSTSGEGFGVPIIEAMSCGVPSVVTDYTTSREFLSEGGQCGELVNLAGVETLGDDYFSNEADTNMRNGTLTGSWNVERGIMSTDSMTEKFDKLYQDRELLRKYSKVCREKAIQNYDFRKVIDAWDSLYRGKLNG